jgi:hypothetical protein
MSIYFPGFVIFAFLLRAISTYVRHCGLTDGLRRKGLIRGGRFGWERCALETLRDFGGIGNETGRTLSAFSR